MDSRVTSSVANRRRYAGGPGGRVKGIRVAGLVSAESNAPSRATVGQRAYPGSCTDVRHHNCLGKVSAAPLEYISIGNVIECTHEHEKHCGGHAVSLASSAPRARALINVHRTGRKNQANLASRFRCHPDGRAIAPIPAKNPRISMIAECKWVLVRRVNTGRNSKISVTRLIEGL